MKKKYLLIMMLFLALKSNSQIVEKINLPFNGDKFNVIIISIDSFVLNRFEIIENNNLIKESVLFDSLPSHPNFFLVNAGIVDSNCNLIGLYINKGIVINNINMNSGVGNFFLKPNGFIGFTKFDVEIKNAIDYNPNVHYTYAVQNGPMLLVDGKINTAFNVNSKNKNYRLGVGIYEQGNQKYLVFATSLTPINFYGFANLFLEKFNCKNALNIESGDFCSFKLPSLTKSYNSISACRYFYLPIK